jgi:DNA-binding Lrp family transcriptional regulator
MVNLDEKDLEILGQLDLNARQSATAIAKKLGHTPNSVNYRINNFEKNGVINGYTTLIDFFKLGYQSFRVYLKLQHVNNKIESEIMNNLTQSNLTNYVSSAKGRFDVCSQFWIKTPLQFKDFWYEFRSKYRPHLKEEVIVPYFGEVRPTLPIINHTLKRETVSMIGEAGTEKIDEKDRIILRLLSNNARETSSNLAKASGLTIGAIKYRIKNLTKRNIIKGYKPKVDIEKLGYTFFKLEFSLATLTNHQKFEKYLLDRAEVANLIRSAGCADSEILIVTKNSKGLYSISNQIRDEFSDDINSYDFFAIPKMVKEAYMPDF